MERTTSYSDILRHKDNCFQSWPIFETPDSGQSISTIYGRVGWLIFFSTNASQLDKSSAGCWWTVLQAQKWSPRWLIQNPHLFTAACKEGRERWKETDGCVTLQILVRYVVLGYWNIQKCTLLVFSFQASVTNFDANRSRETQPPPSGYAPRHNRQACKGQKVRSALLTTCDIFRSTPVVYQIGKQIKTFWVETFVACLSPGLHGINRSTTQGYQIANLTITDSTGNKRCVLLLVTGFNAPLFNIKSRIHQFESSEERTLCEHRILKDYLTTFVSTIFNQPIDVIHMYSWLAICCWNIYSIIPTNFKLYIFNPIFGSNVAWIWKAKMTPGCQTAPTCCEPWELNQFRKVRNNQIFQTSSLESRHHKDWEKHRKNIAKHQLSNITWISNLRPTVVKENRVSGWWATVTYSSETTNTSSDQLKRISQIRMEHRTC